MPTRPGPTSSSRPTATRPRLPLLLAAAVLSLQGALPPEVGAQRPERELPRRGFLVESAAAPNEGAGARIERVGEGSAAARAGFGPGDVIVSVGAVPVERWWEMGALDRLFREGSRVVVVGLRDGEPHRRAVVVPPLPTEELPGVEVSLHPVPVPAGYRVRGVLTRPARGAAPLPAVVLAPWLSCDSVENPRGPGGDGMMRLLHEIATRSGWATFRVDRPGVGDSEGPPCSELDFQEELAAYRAGFEYLRGLPEIDLGRIVVLGLSNGGGFAPLLAESSPAAGYVVIGGWSGTWLEHMLDHERVRMDLAGQSPGEVNAAMRGWATFYDRFLNGGLTPAEVLAEHPALEPLWYGEPDGLYGRSAAFHQQLQALDLDGAWAEVETPTLVMWGDADWIMARQPHERIVELVHRAGGEASLDVVDGMDHFLTLHPSMQSSFDGAQGEFARPALERVLAFLDRLRER